MQAIIPAIRQMTFAGFRIVFSSVIPLDVPSETTDIWRTAVAFGAECYKELNPRITHVVANKVSLSSQPPPLFTIGLMVFSPSFRVEGYGEGRPSSASPTDDQPIDQDRLASMVQRLARAMEAAGRDTLPPGRPFPAVDHPTLGTSYTRRGTGVWVHRQRGERRRR